MMVGNEMHYITDAIRNNWRISGDGPYTQKAQQQLQSIIGGEAVLLTSSCTHALDMSAILLDLKPGDEVIVPSFTFVSTANAYVLHGAKPIFVDVRPDTLNLDESALEAAITPRTRAIVPIHYAGVGCEMDTINAIAKDHNIIVVEDNAVGIFGKYKDQPLGTFGTMATQSFHETKNVMCGEGGALIINDPNYIERAEIIREKGTNRKQFFRGQIDKYTWVDVGSSYLVSDFTAAFLVAQLEQWEVIQQKRHQLWDNYDAQLKEWASINGIKTPYIPNHCDHPAHVYYLLMPSLEQRTHFIDYLAAHDIVAVFHYQSLHLSKMGRSFGGRVGDCPVTERISDTLVRLPLYFDLSLEDQQRVIDVIKTWKMA